MQKTNINPNILQAMLESAKNAADKGQSQFFTPQPLGAALATALPQVRLHLVDLTCGAGDLLQASANRSTQVLFGADIDPCLFRRTDDKVSWNHSKITHDLTQLYAPLREVNFKADCFVLNPPWRLFWYRRVLAALAESALPAVREAFAATEDPFNGGCPKECIDSTIATLAIALDLCSAYGEGLLIANDATLERLLFAPGAPYAALARHVWCRLRIPGNPMTGIENCQWEEDQQFHTGVIYFAREHTVGPKHFTVADARPDTIARQLEPVRQWRCGAEITHHHFATQDTFDKWQVVKEHVAELDGRQPKVPWNLWLTAAGNIRTALSRFEDASTKVNKKEAARLFKLNGKAPMQLVLQRAERDELIHVAEHGGWRVQPELLAAVRAAIVSYHAARAPLYPLPEIQRLGYLDEQDTIECKLDLRQGSAAPFQSGQRYAIRTQTIEVTRTLSKPNSMTGDMEDLELSGQELLILLKSGDKEFAFMDKRLRDDDKTKLDKVSKAGCTVTGEAKPREVIDFTLQDLCAHFIIPDVPDVATVNPAGYEANLAKLAELETILA